MGDLEEEPQGCRLQNDLGRRALAEFLGTFMFVLVSVGSLAQLILGHQYLTAGDSSPTYLVITVAEGIGLALGMYIASGVSGGHVNPAVSFALMLTGDLQWQQLLAHWIGQYTGAFVAACSVYAVYADAHKQFHSDHEDSDMRDAAGSIYASFPQDSVGWGSGFFNITVNSALFMLIFLAVTDDRGTGPKKGHAPGVIGLVLTSIGLSLGLLCGASINPARDLSCRLFGSFLGWDFMVLPAVSRAWFWVPILAPHLGTVIGTIIYYLFIGNHWPREAGTATANASLLDGYILVQENKIYRRKTDRTNYVAVKF